MSSEENNTGNETKSQDQGVQIEVKPITPGSVTESTKDRYIQRIVQNIAEDISAWLETKDLVTVKKYVNYDPLDLFLEYINDYSNALYRRIRRITEVSTKLTRLSGTQQTVIRGPKDIEAMIWQRLATGIADSLGGTVESTRRRRAVDEIIRELKEEEGKEGEQGE